jgi:hypothetical protein
MAREKIIKKEARNEVIFGNVSHSTVRYTFIATKELRYHSYLLFKEEL